MFSLSVAKQDAVAALRSSFLKISRSNLYFFLLCEFISGRVSSMYCKHQVQKIKEKEMVYFREV
jgi:hypothetical protein